MRCEHGKQLVFLAAGLTLCAGELQGQAIFPLPDSLAAKATEAAVQLVAGTLNEQLLSGTAGSGFWRLLKGLELEAKTFQSDSASGPMASGFSYQYHREVRRVQLQPERTRQSALSLSLDGSGNVVLSGDYNPNDFLDGRASFSFYRSVGGVNPPVATPPVTPADIAYFDSINSWTAQAAQFETEEDLVGSDVYRSLMNLVTPRLSTQFYWEIGATAGLESDQRFTREQYTYGVQGAIDLKAWNPGSALARANLFDWPFATLRWLSGSDTEFSPRGYAWPTVLLSLDRVHPTDDDPRSAAGGDDPYPRWKFESAFKTPLLRNGDSWVNFEADFRHYQEIGAPDQVEEQNLDSYSWFAATIVTAEGLFASYTNGRLPLDARSDDTFGLGFRFDF